MISVSKKIVPSSSLRVPQISYFKLIVSTIVNMGLTHLTLFGSVPLVSFDLPVSNGTPVEQISSEWSISDGLASVEAGVGCQGSQGLKIKKGQEQEARVHRTISWSSEEKTAFIDLRIRPAANSAGSAAAIVVNGTQIALQKNPDDTSKGDLWVLNGSDSRWIPTAPYFDGGLNAPQWLLTNGNFTLNATHTAATEYIRVTLRQDFEQKIWDLYVNGVLTAADLRFEELGVLNQIDIFGSTTDDVWIDNFQALPSNMLFTDSDKDGIPDEVEIAMGSNPNLKDRHLVDPASGKSYLQKYLEQLWPNNAPNSNGTYAAPQGTVPPLALPTHTPVGALKGNFSVGGDGSANYSVPIDLPKGTSGMEPQLSIGYSSNGGNGICGVGFGISGLQSITRGLSSLRKDGFIDGVDFDEKDRFYLNGERLVCISGEYGADGSEYRTEVDSYSRIKLYGDANLGHNSYWCVQTKAGLMLQFGYSKSSKVSCSHALAPLAWAVNRVTDAASNYYQISYTQGDNDDPMAETPQGSSTTFSNVFIDSHRVAEIRYTGNDMIGLQPYVTVKFSYENRTDKSFAYTQGIRSENNKILRNITIITNQLTNCIYQFDYAKSAQTSRSTLQKIRKYSEKSTVPHTTTFTWDAYIDSLPASMWCKKSSVPVYLPYDSGQNNDNRIISFASVEDSGSTLHMTGNSWRYITLPTPYQVTQKTLMSFEYKISSFVPEFIAIGLDNNALNDSTHVFYVSGTQLPTNGSNWYNKQWEPLNPNSDPFTTEGSPYYNKITPSNSSLIAPPNTWVKLTIPIGTQFTGTRSNLVFINDDDNKDNGIGSSWFRNVRIYESTDPSSSPIVFPQNNWEIPVITQNDWVDSGYQFLDVNLDGLIDIVRNDLYAASNWHIYMYPPPSNEEWAYKQTLLNTGNGFVTGPATLHPPATLSSHDFDDTDTYMNFMGYLSNFSDYNGDGRPDMMKRFFASSTDLTNGFISFSAMMHHGNGWEIDASVSYPFVTSKGSGLMSENPRFRDWIEGDLNGDGFTDLIANTRQGNLRVSPTDVTPPLSNRVFLNNGWNSGERWQNNVTYIFPDPGDSTTGQVNTPYIKNSVIGDDLGRGLIDLNADGLPDFFLRSFEFA